MKFERVFDVNLNAPVEPRMCGGLLFTGDNESLTVRAQVRRGAEAVEITGVVTAHAIRSDGATVVVEGEASGNEASVTLPSSSLTCVGPLAVMLRVIEGGGKTTILKAVWDVTAGTTETIIDPGHVVPDVDDVIAMMNQAEVAIDAANDAAASADAAADAANAAAAAAATAGESKFVRFDAAQALTDAQKAQALGNIGGASEGDLSDVKSHIKYDTAQRREYNGEPYFFAKDADKTGNVFVDVCPIIPAGSKILLRNTGDTATTANLVASDGTEQSLSTISAGGVIAVANFDVYRLRCYQNSTGHFAIKMQVLDDIGRIDAAINSVRSENLFDPMADYYITAGNGDVRNYGYTVNRDGTVVVTGNISAEQVLLRDPNKKIYPGKYELSGHVTFASDTPDAKRQVVIRLLNAATYMTVNVKTERGGSTDVSNSALTGYFYGEFTVTEESEFGFEIIGGSKTNVSSTLPMTVDQIYIRLLSENDSILNAIKNFQIIPLNSSYPRISGNAGEKIIFSWGNANVYVIENGRDRVTVSFEQIRAAIPDYAVINGTELTITMPEAGVFGFDVKENKFVMLTNYNVPKTVKPLYYRYYNVCFGEMALRDNTAKIAMNNSLRMVYTTATARHTIETNTSTGAIVMHVGSNIVVRMQGWSQGLQWGDISGDIAGNITIDGLKADITVPNNQSLVLNTTDKLLHLRSLMSANYNNIDDIVLLQNAWAVPVRGFLLDEYINRTVQDGDTSPDVTIVRNTFNSGYHVGAQDFAGKCEEFTNCLLGTVEEGHIAPVDFESFLFFTDPHLLEGSAWQTGCYEFMSQIQKYYNSIPVNFCLCGGDWLGNSDLPSQAAFKLGYINGFMRSKFEKSYLLVGNHDTNYQGKKDAESATYTTKLSIQSIKDLWYGGEKAYFSFDGARTRFYCFDTGTEAQAMGQYDNYGWEQAQWFANALTTDNSAHIALAAHILYWQYDSSSLSTGVHPLSEWVLKIAQAYNTRTTISVNGTTYDYSASTGKVEFFIAGHKHADNNGILYGIPWVMTINVRKEGPSFDMCVADYDNNLLKMIRVGYGANRILSFETGELVEE